MKKGTPKKCVACNSNNFVEKHHPDGKKDMIRLMSIRDGIKEYEGNLVNLILVRELTSDGIGRFEFFKKHKHPNKWVYLCKECHREVTTGKKTIGELKQDYHNNIDRDKEMNNWLSGLMQPIIEFLKERNNSPHPRDLKRHRIPIEVMCAAYELENIINQESFNLVVGGGWEYNKKTEIINAIQKSTT